MGNRILEDFFFFDYFVLVLNFVWIELDDQVSQYFLDFVQIGVKAKVIVFKYVRTVM